MMHFIREQIDYTRGSEKRSGPHARLRRQPNLDDGKRDSSLEIQKNMRST